MNDVERNVFRFFLVLTFLTFILISGCSPSRGAAIPPQETQQDLQQVSQQNLQHESQQNLQQESQPDSHRDSQQQGSPREEIKDNHTQEQVKDEQHPWQQSKRAVPILYYHSIDYEEGNELRIPAEEFEAHMQMLWQNGYQCITLEELYQYFYEGGALPEKPFVLTFDDGYEDNYLNAFPIAEKYGFRGTIFMVTNWIDGKGYLKREQLLEMSQAGWQIESHTQTHPYLNSISAEQIRHELLNSKQALEELFQEPVTAFAYPYGVYDSSIIELCKEAGYKMGLTTDRGWAEPDDSFRIKRIYCYAQMGEAELKRRIENQNY